MTMSASTQISSIACCDEAIVSSSPRKWWSTSRSLSRLRSRMNTSECMPTAMVAAAKPATPAPRMTTRAQRTPGTPRDEHAPASTRPHEVVGTHERGHPAGDLAHRCEQRERIVRQTDGLVRDGDVAGRQQRVGALAGRRQVQVGEECLAGAQAKAVVLLGQRLFDLADQVGGGPQLVRVLHDRGARADELGVRHGRAVAGALLDEDRVTRRGELAYPGRGNGHPVLVLLHFRGDADDHDYSSMLLITCFTRV